MAKEDFHPAQRSALRKYLGGLKRDFLNRFVYKHRAEQAQKKRRELEPKIAELPPVKCSENPTFEIHMLCCHRDIDMGIWASWSMLRFVEDSAKLFVHSDGSITEDDKIRWGHTVQGAEFTTKEQRDAVVADALKENCPLVYEWRCQNWASAQLVDMQFFGSAKTILLMDSDVLTFSPPDEVLQAIESETPQFGWCTDLINAYSAPASVLEEVTGSKVVNKLCAGYLVSPRLSVDDYLALESDLQKIISHGRVNTNHFWSCQTYYALIASRYPQSRAFSSIYDNAMGPTKPGQPMRHFVGIPAIRYRYVEEGLATILQQLKVSI